MARISDKPSFLSKGISLLRTWFGSRRAIIPILLAGAVLRVWDLGKFGFNSDEAVYAGQAASMSGRLDFAPYFSVFRAHPLLMQFLTSLVYRLYLSDFVGRLVAVSIGLATVFATYLAGKALFDAKVGILAALFLALMPYAVSVTRQVLVDVPLALFFTLTILFLTKYVKEGDEKWVYATGAASALTFLSKETGILALPVIFIGLRLTHKLKLRSFIITIGSFILTLSPYPISLVLGGGVSRASLFFIWQVSRPPNHEWSFYLTTIPGVAGYLLVFLGLAGIIYSLRAGRDSDILCLVWFLITYAFFQLWPVKGFQYLLPIMPALCIFAARLLERLPSIISLRVAPRMVGLLEGRRLLSILLKFTPALLTLLVVSTLFYGSLAGPVLGVTPQSGSLAATSGLPGGREAAVWIRTFTPLGSVFLTIGPTMVNIIEFYAQHQAYGLSVSLDPLRRNPTYMPIVNPDAMIRKAQIQYLVFDIYSATRSPHFGNRLLNYTRTYHGLPVYKDSQSSTFTLTNGTIISIPIIVIYELNISG